MNQVIRTTPRIHPLMAAAAASVIVVSAAGVGVMTGVLPGSHANVQPAAAAVVAPAALAAAAIPAAAAAAPQIIVQSAPPPAAPKPRVVRVAAVERDGQYEAPIRNRQPIPVAGNAPRSGDPYEPNPYGNAGYGGYGNAPVQVTQAPPVQAAVAKPVCVNCGVIEAVIENKVAGEGSGIGGIGGALLIGGGAVLLSGSPLTMFRRGGHGIGFALATGAMIALYTVWDRQAVAALLIPPIVYYWGSIVLRLIVTTPASLRRIGEVRSIWRDDRRALFAVAILSPMSYCLALYAMTMAPLSYVAPAREISILVAALYGTRFLKEGDAGRRLTAALLMVLGLAGIALA